MLFLLILQVKKAFFALVHNSKFFFCILFLWTFNVFTIGKNKSPVWVLLLVFDDLESVDMLNFMGVSFQVEFLSFLYLCGGD